MTSVTFQFLYCSVLFILVRGHSHENNQLCHISLTSALKCIYSVAVLGWGRGTAFPCFGPLTPLGDFCPPGLLTPRPHQGAVPPPSQIL